MRTRTLWKTDPIRLLSFYLWVALNIISVTVVVYLTILCFKLLTY